MRYSPEHKQAARARLVEACGALAKQQGFGNTGIDALAAAAGVTTGAVYSQFGSKTQLLTAIVENELARTLAAFEGKSAAQLQQALQWYLSRQHVGNPETRQQFETGISRIADVLVAALPDRATAWALMAQAIGGVILARSVQRSETRDEILNAVRTSVLFLLDTNQPKY
jgi:AcrR family transcriptional regulator